MAGKSNLDTRLKTFVEDFANRELLDFLRGVAHNLQLRFVGLFLSRLSCVNVIPLAALTGPEKSKQCYLYAIRAKTQIAL